MRDIELMFSLLLNKKTADFLEKQLRWRGRKQYLLLESVTCIGKDLFSSGEMT